MSRILLAILIVFCCGPAVDSAGQPRKTDSAEVLKQLLTMPAPAPRQAALPTPPEIVEPRPPTFFYRNNTPPDDAPIKDLVEYWARWAHSGRMPSDAVQKRLLDECVANPGILTVFLDLLPDSESTPEKVKNVYDKTLTDEKFVPDWREQVRKWLLYNSSYFLDELIALAHKAKENERDGGVNKEDALSALARVSWTNAEPLLRGLMASGQPRATALALSLFYEHAVTEKDLGNEERYRRDLQAIASNRNQPLYSRNVAIQSLSFTEWSGRDDWYISLFQDGTLLEPNDGDYGLTPLTLLFNSDREKWIPIMVGLLESKDINVRSAAVSCLVLVDDDEEAAKKALVPLLPWLTNPGWANDPSNHRLRLIQTLGTIKIPESVPGLIAAMENDDSERAFARTFAAQSLALYQDPRALPALKRALAKEKDESQRFRILKGLLGSNALPEKEQLEALEEYAAKISTPEGQADVMRYRLPHEEALPPTLSVGRYLAVSRVTPSETLINSVLVRAEELKSENPAVANALVEITHVWQGQQVDLDILRRIANGSADSKTIVGALQRKDKMREGLQTELQGLASIAGAAQGIGAVLLNDSSLAQGILTSEDQTAQIALLACARLTQTALPVELIGKFLGHKDPLLALAAENYLLFEDSREARDLLWQHHPNEAFVTGWRENTYGVNSYEYLVKSEEKLREELLKEKGPIEILAYVHGMDEAKILRIYSDKAVYTEFEDAARYRERIVPMAEVSALKDFLTVGGYADRGPTFMYCHHGCPTGELLMLTKEKGRRVFSQGGYQDWAELQQQFSQLIAGDGAKIHYKLEQEIKGLEVLYAGDLTVNHVAQQNGELRIFVERQATEEEKNEREASYEVDEDDEELLIQLSRRRIELENARLSWRVFANNQLGAITSAPDFYPTIDRARFVMGDEYEIDWDIGPDIQMQVLSQESIVIARNSDGLWRQFAGSKPVRLGVEDASYANPIATRDGKWLIVSKTDSDENEPYHIVRLNLHSGREFRVNLPPADELKPISFLPGIGKVLIRRAKAPYIHPGLTVNGPDRPEYFLLDPVTGTTRPVSGDFTPLFHTDEHFLQATDKADEFWAAVSDGKKNQTQIGRYSLKDFSFKPVMAVPQLIFDSTSMWVDAREKKVYLVYKGQLLRLPLQATEK